MEKNTNYFPRTSFNGEEIKPDTYLVNSRSHNSSDHPGHRAELCNRAFEIYRAICSICRAIIFNLLSDMFDLSRDNSQFIARYVRFIAR